MPTPEALNEWKKLVEGALFGMGRGKDEVLDHLRRRATELGVHLEDREVYLCSTEIVDATSAAEKRWESAVKESRSSASPPPPMPAAFRPVRLEPPPPVQGLAPSSARRPAIFVALIALSGAFISVFFVFLSAQSPSPVRPVETSRALPAVVVEQAPVPVSPVPEAEDPTTGSFARVKAILNNQIKNDVGVKTCFADERKRSGVLPSLTVSFKVEPAGVLTSVSAEEPSMRGTELETCLSSALQAIQLPSFTGDSVVVVHYPFRF